MNTFTEARKTQQIHHNELESMDRELYKPYTVILQQHKFKPSINKTHENWKTM